MRPTSTGQEECNRRNAWITAIWGSIADWDSLWWCHANNGFDLTPRGPVERISFLTDLSG